MKTWVLLSFVGVVIVLFVLSLGGLIRVNKQCVSNPFVYGASHYNSNVKTPLMCTCILGESSFTFNSSGMYPIKDISKVTAINQELINITWVK